MVDILKSSGWLCRMQVADSKTQVVWEPITDLASSVNSGKFTALELVEKSLGLIEEHQEFNAIIATTEVRALERAKQIDLDIADGKAVGRLAGVPFIAKDNFLTFGSETTAASNILRGFEAPYQATAIEKLEAEGAICVAKANLDAFAHGTTTENSDYFTTKNPHDPTKVAGGSSGGPSASVALNLAPFALGTDTGGSIRLPASFCGVVGYKPSYGLISRSGVIAMASSTDVIGPLTSTVEDSALIVDILAGQDPLDSTTIKRQKSYTDYVNPVKPKIGLIKEYMDDDVDPEVKKAIQSAAKDLEDNGADIVEISIPSLPLALAAYYIVVPAEISSNLGRYDGQRFGKSIPSDSVNDLESSYSKSRQQGFGAEAKRRIMTGTYVLSSGYYDAYYKKAQLVRTKIINDFKEAFSKVDFLMGPVSPKTAWDIGEVEDPLAMYLLDIMTVAVSMAGLPAISIPCGAAYGMPVGLQLIAPYKHDAQLLDLAKLYERSSNG